MGSSGGFSTYNPAELESKVNRLEEELRKLSNFQTEITDYIKAVKVVIKYSSTDSALTLFVNNCEEIIRRHQAQGTTPPPPPSSEGSPPRKSRRLETGLSHGVPSSSSSAPNDETTPPLSSVVTGSVPTSQLNLVETNEATESSPPPLLVTPKIEPGQISDRWTTNPEDQDKRQNDDRSIRLVVRGKLIKTEILDKDIKNVTFEDKWPEIRISRPKSKQNLNKTQGILGLYQEFPYIPWGTAVTDEDINFELTNTCSIDNTLMILMVMTSWYPKVGPFLESQYHSFSLAESIVDSINFAKLKQFNMAKGHWLKYVAKERLLEKPAVTDCFGSEDERCASRISPLFTQYRVTHLCPVHGQVFEGEENICSFEHGTLDQILEAIHGQINEPDLRCNHYESEGCRQPIKSLVTRPEGMEPLPFLMFHPIEEHSIHHVQKKIVVLNTKYELFAASLHQRARNHFVAAFSFESHWITYDGLKDTFHLGLQDHDAVSLLWYVREQEEGLDF